MNVSKTFRIFAAHKNHMAEKKNHSGMMQNVRNGLLFLVALVVAFFVARAVVQVRNLKEQNARMEDRIRQLEMLASVGQDTLSARYVPFQEEGEKRRVSEPGDSAPVTRKKADSRKEAVDSASSVPYIPITQKKKDDYPKQEKFQEPTRVELNTADTTLLKKIPGIGSTTALNIIRYRDQLGGFYSPLQLGEKLKWEKAQEMLPEWVSQWMAADPGQIRKLNVNHSDFKTLVHHPYLNYEQVKALFNYRRNWGNLSSIEALKQLEEFSEDDIQRLRFYLEF